MPHAFSIPHCSFTHFKKEVFVKSYGIVLAASALVFFVSCANNPSGLAKQKTGTTEIWASIVKPQTSNVLAKSKDLLATSWDSLVIVISASDMDSMVITTKFVPTDPYISEVINSVPAGSKRTFAVYTKTKDGMVIHTSASQIVDVQSSAKQELDFNLIPIRGSIYVDLSNIPTSVKQMCAEFGGLTACADRATKLYLSIDNIPDKTADSLILQGTDSSGAPIYRSALWLVFSVLRDTSVTSGFYRITTGATVAVTAQIPASTIVSGNVGSQKTIALETGRLIISEIMYNTNDSEYVEVYNPGIAVYNDSLILDIDGTCRSYGIVTIGPKGYLVIGRRSLPWADVYNSVSSALDLSSTGNWLSLRSKSLGDTVMDWVAFAGGSNSQEWPNLGTAKKSIVLDSVVADPTYNNFGKNWKAAQTAISQLYPSVSTGQYGTPRSAGL
jgi:hypothetical protein